MATVTEDAVSTATIYSTLEQTHEEIFETIDAFEFYQISASDEVGVTANATSSVEIEVYAHAISVAHIQDQLTYTAEATKELVENASFSVGAALGYEATVTSAAAFSEQVGFYPTLPLYSQATFVSAVAPTLTTVVSVTERAQFEDRIAVGLGQIVNETAHFVTSAAPARLVSIELNETANFTTGGGAASQISAALSETANFMTAVDHTATTNAWAFSVANFTSEVDYLDPLAKAWVMNTETTAMSQYMGYDFESVAQYKGVLYGINRDGIYVLEGEKDAGLSINTLLETGYMDFGIDEKKRIPNLYLGFTMAGGVIRLTTWTRKNPAQKYSYDTPVLPYKQPVNSRFTLGKGLNHEYWKFALTNRNGAYFALDKWSADVAISSRRIG